MGWFSLVKSVKQMLEFEKKEQKVEPSDIPFLMNLQLFKKNIESIKAEMV